MPPIPPDDSAPDDGSLDEALRNAFADDEDEDEDEDEDQDSSPSVLERLGRILGTRPEVVLNDTPTPSSPTGNRSKGEEPDGTAGKYQIFDELGRGGVGTVLRGRDQDLGRDVALKFLHDRYRHEPSLLQRFVEEAQIGGQLQHPGIVPVYELGMRGERPFFAMKLVKGETLAQQLGDRASPADRRGDFLRIFESICQTVAYAHARGVVHRDLKPANVMIGSFGEVQVVDWGMGKVLLRPDTADAQTLDAQQQSIIETVRSRDGSTQSVVGSVMGTPAYMPPEQARGDVESMDARSDVFALGAILCEILTGAPPYVGGADELLAMAAMARQEDAQARLASCGADPEMIDLARQCLQPAPDARPADAERVAGTVHAFLAALESKAHDARVEAAEAEVRAEGLRRTQRLGLCLTAAITAGLLTSLWFWFEADRAAERERTARGEAVAAAERAEANERLADEQRRIAERELERALEIKRLIADMIGSVDPTLARASDKTLLLGILARAQTRLDEGAVDDELVAAELRTLLGRVYTKLGELDVAERHLEPALVVHRRRLGNGAHPTIETLSALSILRKQQGRAAEAETLVRELIGALERAPDRPAGDLLSARGNLALFVHNQGRYEEAERLFVEQIEQVRATPGVSRELLLNLLNNYSALQQDLGRLDLGRASMLESLALQNELYGPDHPATALTLLNLGLNRQKAGELEAAQDYYEQSLALQQRVLPPNHPAALRTRGNLAMLRLDQGDPDGAYESLRELDGAMEAALGPDHPDRTGARGNLALCLKRLGRLEEARHGFEAALATARRVLGEQHPQTLLFQRNLTITLLDLGEPESALPLLEDLVEEARSGLGEEAPLTLQAVADLGELYGNLGRNERAEQLLEESLETLTRVLGSPHASTVRTRRSLAALYEETGRLEEAEQLLRTSLDQLPDDAPEHARTLAMLGSILVRQDRLEEGRRLFRDALQAVADGQADALSRETAAHSRSGLGQILLRTGRPLEARPLLQAAYDEFLATLAPDDLLLSATRTNLATTYLMAGAYADAAPLFAAQLAEHDRSGASDTPEIAALITNLGLSYANLGRFEEAAEQFERSVPLKRRELGPTHPWTQNALQGLATCYLRLGRTERAMPLQRELLEAQLQTAKAGRLPPQSMNQLAWQLLTHEVEELQNPEQALDLAQRLCRFGEQRGDPSLWSWLDTLALALHRTGSHAQAVQRQRQALEAAPSDAPPSEIHQMRERLADYESAARDDG